MSISVKANVKVNDARLVALIANLIPGLQAVIAEFAQQIYDTAYPNVPERSGADRASLLVEVGDLLATISLGRGITPPYPVFQEMGFHHWKSGQFIQNAALVPAFEQHLPAFLAAIQGVMGGP